LFPDVQPPTIIEECENKEVYAAILGQPNIVTWNDPQVKHA
jgi:hypothetical protein